MTVQPTMLRPATPKPVWQVVLGFVLMLPALVLLITSYVEPVIWNFRHSFQKFTGVRAMNGEAGESTGWDNYDAAFHGGLGGALGYTLGLAVLPVLVVLLLAPALAWTADASGRA